MEALFPIVLCVAVAAARKIPPIDWVSTNPIFASDNSGHILTVSLLDQISLLCPNTSDSAQYSHIYLVSSAESAQCALGKTARLAGICRPKHPPARGIVTLTFRSFSPNPTGLEFLPNQEYYFISTSTGTESGLDNRIGGLCASRSMRLRVHVLPRHRRPHPPPRVRTLDGEPPSHMDMYGDQRKPGATTEPPPALPRWTDELGASFQDPRAEWREDPFAKWPREESGLLSDFFPDKADAPPFRDLPSQPTRGQRPPPKDFIIHYPEDLDDNGGRRVASSLLLPFLLSLWRLLR